MVVKNAAKDVPMLASKAVSRDLYNQQLSTFAPNAADTTDFDIFFNLCFSAAFGLIIFTIFVVLRPHFLRLYSATNVGAQRAILPHRREGHVKWMKTVWGMGDAALLAWCGLDGFLLVQVMRLMAVVSVALVVPLLLVLVPAYAMTGPSEVKVGSWYYRMSILNMPVKWLWLPALTSWLLTVIFCYVVYVFYRNFVNLRQAYLKEPSAFTPITSLQRLVRITGDEQKARQVASFHTRTILVDGIHRRYGTEEVKRLLDETVAGPCQSVAFVSPRGDLLGLAESRNKALEVFEESLQTFLNNCFDELLGSTTSASDRGKFAKGLQEKYTFSFQDRVALFKLVLDPGFHSACRPQHAVDQDGKEEQVDSITHYHAELCRLDDELNKALADYQANNGLVTSTDGGGDGGGDADSEDISEQKGDTEKGEVSRKRDCEKQCSLTDPARFFHVSHNLKDITLTTGHHNRLALAVFPDQRHAAITTSPRLPLSRRPLSLHSQPAPAHEDVLWENVQLPLATRKARWASAILLNIAINLAYAPIVGMLNALCSLERLSYWWPAVGEFVQEHRWLRAFVQGVLVPVVMNIGFALAPVYLKMIALYSGAASKTAVNAFMVDSYGSFLFFQSFVVITVSASILDIFRETASGNFASTLTRLRQTLPTRAPIFLNMFIQRLLISLPMAYLRVIPLLAHNAMRKLSQRQTPRKLHDIAAPTDVDMGTEYPGSIIYAMQVLLAFMSFAPVNLLASALFFLGAQFTYKYALMYMAVVKTESGGVYWVQVCRQLLIGLGLHHLFLVVHFSFRKSTVACLLMVPPLLFIPAFLSFLDTTFGARMHSSPLTTEDDARVCALIDEVSLEQRSMLRDYHGSVGDGDGDGDGVDGRDEYARKHRKHADATAVTIRELTSAVESAEDDQVTALITANPYMNPVLFRKYYSILLDPAFFPMIKQLLGE